MAQRVPFIVTELSADTDPFMLHMQPRLSNSRIVHCLICEQCETRTLAGHRGATLRTTEMAAENTASKQRGRPFPKGRSGNPRGRPPGARNVATVIAEQLLDGEAETLIRKAIQKAKQGNLPALRMCLDRILPPRRERPVKFKLPELSSAADASVAMASITSAVARGELTPAEAGELSKLVESYVRAIEVTEIERRLQVLEASHAP